MVKIKEGYVMSPREQTEFDRKNALPRKASGRVDFYFKPQTKYPPRIYVYMHAEIWCDRNRRPMGLYNAVPFLSRPMNKEEIEYHHFDFRLCYHQYEDWNKLIYAEEQEAGELNRELPGTGSLFLEKLMAFRSQYSLGVKPAPVPKAVEIAVDNGDSAYLKDLIHAGQDLTAKEISERLVKEQEGQKRLAILILLRELYKNIVLPDAEKVKITGELVNKKVCLSQERSRKNFVRRTFKTSGLFALEEIRDRYPDYTESMLFNDLLKIRQSVKKKKKRKPVTDLRRCQMIKLSNKLNTFEPTGAEYNALCCTMVMLQNAHDLRLPIPLTVKFGKEPIVYSFHWSTRENDFTTFSLANTKGMNHERLKEKHQEMVSSSYSY